MTSEIPHRWFLLGCIFEAAQLLVAVLLGRWLDQPLLASILWDGREAMLGGLAAVPLFFVFRTSLASPWAPVADIRRFLEKGVRPIFRHWSLAQLAVISILAGVSEEALFRGVLQGTLTKWAGPTLGIVVSNLLFGLCHPMTRAYAVVAGLIGAFLGALLAFTGNLLTPIITHTLYDFAALVYFLRVCRPKEN